MRTYFFCIIFSIWAISCTKKEYIIEEPIAPLTNKAPNSFNLALSNITNTNVTLDWDYKGDPEGDTIKYEVAINDSVIAYDLTNTRHTIKNLISNTRYSASVNALDSARNMTSASIEFKTMKPFLQNIISFDDYFYFYVFDKAIATNDEGVLIGGRIQETILDDSNKQFILKLDKDYKIEWYQILDTTGYITDLLESHDTGYLIVLNNSVYKTDNDGSKIWEYLSPYPKDDTYLQCSVQNDNGDFILAGLQSVKLDGSWNIKYVLLKLCSDGTEQWWKFGGTTLQNRPSDIVIEPSGNIVIFGTAEYTGKTGDDGSTKSCYWLLWCDEFGNFIKQEFYINEFTQKDIAKRITRTTNGDYLLMGTAVGPMPPYGYSSFIPRFTKIKKDGSVIWDKCHKLNSGGLMPIFVDFSTMDNNKNLILTKDDRGIAISIIDDVGEVEKHIKLYGYPSSIFLRYTKDKNYHVITYDNSSILVFNSDGYIEKNSYLH
ncbi:fibronectin type III domain-containing protein [Sunxiuqinia elliptica]